MPYTKDDWNKLIEQINEKLQNPPEDTDCEPIAPIELVDDNHRWSVDDITTVRNKLTQMCKDNTFTAELKYWSQDIVDELDSAADWCECEDECVYECLNAAENDIVFLGTHPKIFVSAGVETRDESSTCSAPHFGICVDYRGPKLYGIHGRTWTRAESIQYQDLYWDIEAKIDEWTLLLPIICDLKDKVEKLEDEVEEIEGKIERKQDEITTAVERRNAICASNPGSSNCVNLTQIVTELENELTVLENELTEKEAELVEKEEELAEKERERDAALEYIDAKAAENWSMATAFYSSSFHWINVYGEYLDEYNVIDGPMSWIQENFCTKERGTRKPAQPKDCQVTWEIKNEQYHTLMGEDDYRYSILWGKATPNGLLYSRRIPVIFLPWAITWTCLSYWGGVFLGSFQMGCVYDWYGHRDNSDPEAHDDWHDFTLTIEYPIPHEPICE